MTQIPTFESTQGGFHLEGAVLSIQRRSLYTFLLDMLESHSTSWTWILLDFRLFMDFETLSVLGPSALAVCIPSDPFDILLVCCFSC